MSAGVWPTEAVLALAPDAASARSGRELSNPRKWASYGRDEAGLWGECQGSGAKPYQTAIDLAGDAPAFHCSCPSRKFPCKHGLGLFLLHANEPGKLPETDAPAWVASWREGRSKRAEKKAERAAVAAADPESDADAAKKAQQKARRQAARCEAMAAGLEDLALWLADIVRQGLVAVPDWPPKAWDERARRLVDAQMPALAGHVRRLGDMPLSGPDWQGLLLERLARLHLLVEGARRLDELPEELQATIRAAQGVPVETDALRAGPALRDAWQVLGSRAELLPEDRLRLQRTWLLGRESGRVALLLDFAHLSQPRGGLALVPGTAVAAAIAPYPGAGTERALLVERLGEPAPLGEIAGAAPIADAWSRWTALGAESPWTDRTLVALRDVVLERADAAWRLRDAAGAVLPVSPRFDGGWDLLARTGGAPVTLAGEFDGRSVLPLGVAIDGAYHPVPQAGEPEAELPAPPPLGGPPALEAAWRELTTSAVVGVERRPPDWSRLDPVLGPIAAGLADRDPPARLLAAAGALALYARAGRLPDRDAAPLPDPSPPEDRPAPGPAPTRRLLAMLGGTHAEFLDEWLGLLADRGGRLPHEALVELLGRARGGHALRPAVGKVLGRRGRWLAGWNPDWAFAAGVEPPPEGLDEAWQTGDVIDRLAAFGVKRAADPDGARGWLESTWNAEPADRRADFVARLEANLGAADEPFLERALDDRSKVVRRLAAGLLSRLPASRLAARMRDRAAAVVHWEAPPEAPAGGLLGRVGGMLSRLAGASPPTLVVVPPVACPADWVRDGIEPKLDSEAKAHDFGERAWWLAQVVEAVPASSWAEMLGAGPAAIVAAAAATEWGGPLRWGWSRAARRDGDAAWAAALLDWPKADRHHEARAEGLFRLLPPEERDRRIQAALEADAGRLRSRHAALRLLLIAGGPLGEPAARALVARLQGELAEGRSRERHEQHYETRSLLARLPALLPVSLLAEAERGWPVLDAETTPSGYHWAVSQSTIDELVAALRFRRELHEEFSR
jgi:hypothetical protein